MPADAYRDERREPRPDFRARDHHRDAAGSEHRAGEPGADRAPVGELTWRQVRPDDFPLLARWLAAPRVARWWNHETSPDAVERDFGPSARGDEPNQDLLVHLDGRPVGLVQRSAVADYAENLRDFASLTTVPSGAVTLDYLLGEPEDLGRGLGPRVIAAIVEDSWREFPTAPAVLVSVVAANRGSWRALEKAGLRRVAEGDLEPDHPQDDPLHYVYRVDRP